MLNIETTDIEMSQLTDSEIALVAGGYDEGDAPWCGTRPHPGPFPPVKVVVTPIYVM